MSESNGIFRIERKGMKKVAVGPDADPVELDVVLVYNQWVALDAEFYGPPDDKGMQRLIPGKSGDRDTAIVKFARDQTACNDVNLAEALAFIAWLRKEKEELVNFFVPKSSDGSPSPKPSGSEVVFTE